MKSRFIALLGLALTFSLGACHYGQDAAEESVKTNEEYKGIRAEKEAATALPDDAAATMGGTAPADTVTTETTDADTSQ